MAKLSIIFLLSSSICIVFVAFLLPFAFFKPKVTNIRLYLHDQFNTSQPISYGDSFAFEDPLTAGPARESTFLGHARGTIAFSNQIVQQDIHVSLAYVFSSGEYNGSTVVAVGRNDVSQSSRQFPIVGGTGAFKLARGVVTGSTYSLEPPIYIYDLEIINDNHCTGIIGMFF